MMSGHRPAIEGQLAYVKAELGITDAQAPAWDGYAKAVRDRVTVMQAIHATTMKIMQTGSAVERLDTQASAMQAMADTIRSTKPATEALYAVLTDDQKKKADLLLGGRCCMM